MARLENITTGNILVLRHHHIFGRSKSKADTLLVNKDISQVHASFRWDGRSWRVADHSRNGTWLEGSRLIAGKTYVLNLGNTIQLGCSENSTWRVKDLEQPFPVLIPLDGTQAPLKLNKLHVLPDEQNPQLTIYTSAAGQWVYETDAGPNVLRDGDILDAASLKWQFCCPSVVEATLESKEYQRTSVDEFFFTFHVSLDEEHVFLKLSRGDGVFDLGERVHHYLLLVLARCRMEDARKEVDLESQGWVELSQLSTMLGLDAPHINIQIFRARRQLIDVFTDILHLPQVVERRSGSVRFGYPCFKIIKGSQVEGEIEQGNLLENLSA